MLGLGSNLGGAWGPPAETIRRAIDALETAGLEVIACSRLITSRPVGPVRQPTFVNAVVVVRTRHGAVEMLRRVKQIERAAGRRIGVRWGPRALDIDLLDIGGRRHGAGARRTMRGRLVLPHPEIARRGFVLVPLAEVAPGWRHPLLCVTAAALLKRQPRLRQGIRPCCDCCD